MTEAILAGKKILFIAPHFFDYEIEITRKLERLGTEVFFYDERPSNSVFAKTMIRINRRMLHHSIARHFARMMNEMKGRDPDYVFIIKGETMSRSLIERMRTDFPHAKIILYLWDSIRNNPNISALLPLFDRALTFDLEDAHAEERLIHRPLFYLDEYADASAKTAFEYDACFIGTLHSDRFAVIKRIAARINGKIFFHMFFHTRLLYAAHRLFDKGFKGARIGMFRFTPLCKRDTVNAIASSRAVIDIQHPRQTGLTIRTIEIFGAKRKLITTNGSIRKYDLYNPDNVLVVDRERCEIDPAFLLKPFAEIDSAIYEYYSMDRWVRDIFGL